MCWLCQKTKGIAHLESCKKYLEGSYIGNKVGRKQDYWLRAKYCYNWKEFFVRRYIRILMITHFFATKWKKWVKNV